MQFSSEEEDVIASLHGVGQDYVTSVIAVLMYTRQHCRQRAPLVTVALRGYPGLEHAHDIEAGVATLIDAGWLQEVSDGPDQPVSVKAADDLPALIQARTGSAIDVTRMEHARNLTQAPARLMGPVSDPAAERAFRLAVLASTQVIQLPMLATPASFEGLEDLLSRARAGVRIEIILSSPRLAQDLRGPGIKRRAEEAAVAWAALSKAEENVVVRLAYREAAMLFAASAGFDRVRVQLAVYDVPNGQRSQDATVVAVYQNRQRPNLVRQYNAWFDAEWGKARPLDSRFAAGRWWVTRVGWELGLITSSVSLALTSNERLQNVAAGALIACTPGTVKHFRDYREDVKRVLRRRLAPAQS